MDLKEEDPPQKYVNWANIKKVLQSFIDYNNINTSLVMKLDGSLLCVAGDKSKGKTIAALGANIYKSYNHDDNNLSELLINAEDGHVILGRISKFLVCHYTTEKCNITLLREQLKLSLEQLESLQQVYPNYI